MARVPTGCSNLARSRNNVLAARRERRRTLERTSTIATTRRQRGNGRSAFRSAARVAGAVFAALCCVVIGILSAWWGLGALPRLAGFGSVLLGVACTALGAVTVVRARAVAGRREGGYGYFAPGYTDGGWGPGDARGGGDGGADGSC